MYQVIDGKVITNNKTYLKGDIIDEKLSKDDAKRLLDMKFIKTYKEKTTSKLVDSKLKNEIGNKENSQDDNDFEKKLRQENKDKIIEKAKELQVDFNEEETKEEIISKILDVINKDDGPNTSI